MNHDLSTPLAHPHDRSSSSAGAELEEANNDTLRVVEHAHPEDDLPALLPGLEDAIFGSHLQADDQIGTESHSGVKSASRRWREAATEAKVDCEGIIVYTGDSVCR